MKPTWTTLDQRDFTAELEEKTITESNSESLLATPSSPTGAFSEPCSFQPETVTASPMTDGSTITHVPTSVPVLTGQISLRGGRNRFEGLVEVEYGGHQGGICAKRWDNRNAAVVCRQLGFSGMAWATSRIKLREGDLPVSILYVKCSGDETSLDGCEVKRGVECGTTERAGVHCQGDCDPATCNCDANDEVWRSDGVSQDRQATL
ncbi:neurotrypsin-like [Acipenser ruthenus]|uniref:neurotrypsin-like n=1 Tax=Acipenser ruthenus TaxID=7906 RepID=UPI0027408ACA|nr:neurotrypsin-like [Acipenser ruthenus]